MPRTRNTDSDTSRVRQVAFINGSGDTVIPHAAMRIVDRDADGLFVVGYPSVDNPHNLISTAPVPVANDPGGWALVHRRVGVAWDTTGPTPKAGEIWGARAGQWSFVKGNTGFVATENSSATAAGSATADHVDAVMVVVRQTRPNPDIVLLRARHYTATLTPYTRKVDTIISAQLGAVTAIDGVNLAVGDRVLYAPTAASGFQVDSGLYSLTFLGSGSTYSVLTRTGDPIKAGTLCAIGPENTFHGNTVWQQRTADPVTLNTTPLAWVKVLPAGANVQWVKVLASAGTGWDTSSVTSNDVASAGTIVWYADTGLKILPGDTITATADVTDLVRGTVASYDTLTGKLIVTATASTGTGNFNNWTIAVTTVQGVYPGFWYDGDFNVQTSVWVADANNNVPNVGIFYKGMLALTTPVNGRDLYHTEVSGNVDLNVICSGTNIVQTKGPAL